MWLQQINKPKEISEVLVLCQNKKSKYGQIFPFLFVKDSAVVHISFYIKFMAVEKETIINWIHYSRFKEWL